MAKKRRTVQTTKSTDGRTANKAKRVVQRAEVRMDRGVVRGLELNAGEVERALLMDDNREAIDAVVGAEYAGYLRQLAQEASQVRSRGGKRVLILPGILGSTLAVGNDTVWFDPIDIARGKLMLLSLDGGASDVTSNGVFWPTYAELYLRLRIGGFRPEYFHFDWRKPIVDAGKRLADLIEKSASSSEPVSLVAHSMGGLVSRAALKMLGTKAKSLISETVLLGTPNFGSYAPAMVMTGDYSTVQWVERLDLVNPTGVLIKDVFSTFIGLAEMMPEIGKTGGVDLFDVNSYPSKQRAVRKEVLKKANGLQSRLAEGSDAIWMFAGVGLETVVGIEGGSTDPSKFKFRRTTDGDETVPLSLAMLPGAKHRFCNVSHGKLPSDNEVIRATMDVLNTGETSRLSDSASAATRSMPRSVEVSARTLQLQRAIAEGRSGMDLSDADLKVVLEPLLSVEGDPTRAEPVEGQLMPSDQPIVVSRKYQTRLDLRLTLGDIGEAEGRAIMLGIFKDVRPGGAAGAIDTQLGGILAEIIDRRMFSAKVGELFVLPTPRYGLKAEMVVLIGLGSFSQFSTQSLRSSVENATRTLLRCKVDELVTVPLGGGSGLEMEQIAEAMIEGLQAALNDSQGRPSLRWLGITTHNRKDYERLCQHILSLASSKKFDGMEFTLDREVKLIEDRGQKRIHGSPLVVRHSSTYLIVRETPNPHSENDKKQHFVDFAVLGASDKATVISGQSSILKEELKQLLLRINDAKSVRDFFDKSDSLGQQLAELVLPPKILDALKRSKPEALTVINDFWGSKLPWELVVAGDWKAGLQGNLSRKYATANISVAKWLHERRAASDLQMLLVVNPTSDLDGAKEEGKRILAMAGKNQGIQVTSIVEGEATKDRLAKEFASGKYDLVHYAGHAYFDEANRSQSGILCAGNQVLSGRDLAALDSLPSLVVFNACELARVRSATLPTRMSAPRANAKKQTASLEELVDRNVSLAEAFLRGGVGAFVGTYWPVGDAAASTFAEKFYADILACKSVGDSLRTARESLFNAKEPDWANFIHYGDTDFQIKTS